jgi:hypothetical protein
VVHVTLPLPLKLRSHGFSEPGYNMYAIVRRVELAEDGFRVVGLEFLGAHPPGGYLYNPWATFRTQQWAGAERRREPRVERAEPVMIHFLNESMQTISYEMTVTENLSLSGARVIIKSDPPDFDVVRMTGLKRRFEGLALLRNRFTGEDNSERICLKFIDNKWPM